MTTKISRATKISIPGFLIGLVQSYNNGGDDGYTGKQKNIYERLNFVQKFSTCMLSLKNIVADFGFGNMASDGRWHGRETFQSIPPPLPMDVFNFPIY